MQSTSLQRIQELRVADHELHYGTGAVYTRLSAGAVGVMTDRAVAQARVSRQIVAAVREHEILDNNAVSPSSTTIKFPKKSDGSSML